MDLDKFTLLNMAKQRMAWSARRQEVIAKNIANADTPLYKAGDIKGLTFKRELEGIGPLVPASTSKGHMTAAPMEAPHLREYKDFNPYEVSPSGNSVVLEDQGLKMSDTKGAFDLAANLYQKQVKMMRNAVSGRGSGGM
jgi:flagellar basal-body rod protein FlgB